MFKQRISTFTKFFVSAVFVIIILALFLTFVLGGIIGNSFIKHVNEITSQDILLEAQTLQPEDFSFTDPQRTKKIFSAFYDRIRSSEIFQIKVWDTAAKVIFSNDETVIGKTFVSDQEYNKTLQQGMIITNLESQSKAEKIYEQTYKQALEMYIPITFAGLPKPSGVIEVYVKLDELNNIIWQIKIVQIIATTVFILAAFILFYILFKLFIYQPLNKLINITNSFETGNLSARIEIDSKDEFGKLGIAFNNMAVKLQELYLHLEEKVKTRTQDLQKAKKESEKHAEQLEKTKVAVLNLLEDLKSAKSEIEIAKIKDDAILENIGEGLIVTDAGGKISLINRAATIMLGYEIKDLLGKDLEKLLPIVDEKGNLVLDGKRPTQQVLKSCKTAVCSTAQELFYVKKDKTKFPASIVAAPIIINHKITGVAEVFHDISKEKEIDRMKTEFLSIAAHQLRTPLGSMRWSMEMLLGGDLGEIPPKIKDMVTKIYESNQVMISLVNDLLDVSRIEQGKVPNTPKLTDINSAIKSVIDETQIEAKMKKITISFDSGKDKIPEILIDPLHLKEVIDNLVINAIHYNKVNGKVDIVLEKLENSVKLSVINTGKSIPEVEQPRLFTKFFRGIDAVKSETKGTGLGLFVVKSYIESWGGKVWVKSPIKDNQGTIFCVEIPLKPKV